MISKRTAAWLWAWLRIRWLLVALPLLGGTMSAQTPTTTVNDYLSVRIFAPGSPDFARIASSLGVAATLPTLGPGASLVVALRNDSGEAIDSMRLLFQVHQGDRTFPRITLWGPLAAGRGELVAPREVEGALSALIHSEPGGLRSTSPAAESIQDFMGAQITASIDSVTLASGHFIGADTLAFFSRLVENDARQKAFFADLVAQSKTLPEAQIIEMLTARKVQARSAKQRSASIANFSLADQTEFGLATMALAQLQHFGMATLASWAERENAKLESKPTLHR
jgi:hypothetical protein